MAIMIKGIQTNWNEVRCGITSTQQDECQIYWTQQGHCVRHHQLGWESQAYSFLSLKWNNWECIINILIFESFLLFWRQCVCFFSQWGIFEGKINCNLPALLSLKIKLGFSNFFPLFFLPFSTSKAKHN